MSGPTCQFCPPSPPPPPPPPPDDKTTKATIELTHKRNISLAIAPSETDPHNIRERTIRELVDRHGLPTTVSPDTPNTVLSQKIIDNIDTGNNIINFIGYIIVEGEVYKVFNYKLPTHPEQYKSFLDCFAELRRCENSPIIYTRDAVELHMVRTDDDMAWNGSAYHSATFPSNFPENIVVPVVIKLTLSGPVVEQQQQQQQQQAGGGAAAAANEASANAFMYRVLSFRNPGSLPFLGIPTLGWCHMRLGHAPFVSTVFGTAVLERVNNELHFAAFFYLDQGGEPTRHVGSSGESNAGQIAHDVNSKRGGGICYYVCSRLPRSHSVSTPSPVQSWNSPVLMAQCTVVAAHPDVQRSGGHLPVRRAQSITSLLPAATTMGVDYPLSLMAQLIKSFPFVYDLLQFSMLSTPRLGDKEMSQLEVGYLPHPQRHNVVSDFFVLKCETFLEEMLTGVADQRDPGLPYTLSVCCPQWNMIDVNQFRQSFETVLAEPTSSYYVPNHRKGDALNIMRNVLRQEMFLFRSSFGGGREWLMLRREEDFARSSPLVGMRIQTLQNIGEYLNTHGDSDQSWSYIRGFLNDRSHGWFDRTAQSPLDHNVGGSNNNKMLIHNIISTELFATHYIQNSNQHGARTEANSCRRYLKQSNYTGEDTDWY
jgi:hypothetical protein